MENIISGPKFGHHGAGPELLVPEAGAKHCQICFIDISHRGLIFLPSCDCHVAVIITYLQWAVIKIPGLWFSILQRHIWSIPGCLKRHLLRHIIPPLNNCDSDQTWANYCDFIICLYVLIFNCFHVHPITKQQQIEINFLSMCSQSS